jgi:hypothetical protein
LKIKKTTVLGVHRGENNETDRLFQSVGTLRERISTPATALMEIRVI